MSIKYFDNLLPAGFPSQAEDYVEQLLDLNHLIVPSPSSTFFIRVEGDSMQGAQITSGDLLVVDRAVSAMHGDIVVAMVQGEFTVKRLELSQNKVRLIPENPKYLPIEVSEGHDFQVWGVVTYVIHRAR